MGVRHKRQCPKCLSKLFEGGKYCPCCAYEFSEPALLSREETKELEVVAYCQHQYCNFKGLFDPHPFCPYCAGSMHLYIDVCEKFDIYPGMFDVEVEFRIRKVAKEVLKITSLRARSRNIELDPGEFYVLPGQPLLDPEEKLPVSFRYSPAKKSAKETIELELCYIFEEKEYIVSGRYPVLLKVNLDQHDSANNISIHLEGEAKANFIEGISAGGKKIEYDPDIVRANEQLRSEGRFKPIRCTQRPVFAAVQKTRANILAKPNWPPTDSGRIWFETAGKLYNYCLLTKSLLVFGRKQSACDVRLFEVELCAERIEKQAQCGVPVGERSSGSQVSGRQWQMEPANDGIRVTQLSNYPSLVKPGDRKLQKGKVLSLNKNESVEVPAQIGLKYSADLPLTNEVMSAHEKLAKAFERPFAANAGDLAGHRLDRMYSLCDEPPKGVKDYKIEERYILDSRWCSIGSSPQASIYVPDASVEKTHAYLLFIGGYFYALPRTGAAIFVEDVAMESTVPAPLNFGQRVRLGNVTLVFDKPEQMFV